MTRHTDYLSPDYIQAIASVFSVLVAVGAMIIALIANRRTTKQFVDSQKLAERIGIANIKPMVSTYTLEYKDNVGIILTNVVVVQQ